MTRQFVDKLNRDKTILEWIHDVMASRKYPDKIKKAFLANPELSSKHFHEFCQFFAFTGEFVEEQSSKIGLFAFTVKINGEKLATGHARSKKAGKNEAARSALNLIFKQLSDFSISSVPGQINYDGKGHSVVMKNPTLNLDHTIETIQLNSPNITRDELRMNGVDKFIKFCQQNNEGYQVLVHKLAASPQLTKNNSSDANAGGFIVQIFFNNVCIGSGQDVSLQNAYSLAGYSANKNITDGLSEIQEYSFNDSQSKIDSQNINSQFKGLNYNNNNNNNANTIPEDLNDGTDIGQVKLILFNFLKQLKLYLKQESFENVTLSKSIAAFFVKCQSGIKLISFASGTGFCDSHFLSPNGKVINNCHAMVLAQRAFKRYLLFELGKYSELNKAKSLDILNFDGEKYKLKDDVEFILLMTKSPCGDTTATDTASKGCLHHIKLPPNAQNSNGFPEETDGGNNRDIWEDMVEKIYEPTESTGQGHASNVTINQSLDNCVKFGMKRMSCTDKLTSWNVLGFQGSLINVLLEAIYVPLIVFCNNDDDQSDYIRWTTHSKLSAEFSSIYFDLPGDFVAYEPEYVTTSDPFEAIVGFDNAENSAAGEHYAINWYYPAIKPEIIDCMTGTLYSQNISSNNAMMRMSTNNAQHSLEPSRLCKAAQFFYFQKCIEKKCVMASGYDLNMNYNHSKLFNKDYTEAKKVFHKLLSQTAYGKWIKHDGFGEFHIEHN